MVCVIGIIFPIQYTPKNAVDNANNAGLTPHIYEKGKQDQACDTLLFS